MSVTSYPPYYAFDGIIDTKSWRSVIKYSSGPYTGTVTTQLNDNSLVSGEWV